MEPELGEWLGWRCLLGALVRDQQYTEDWPQGVAIRWTFSLQATSPSNVVIHSIWW